MKTKKISLRWIMLAVLALSLPNFISPQSIRRSVGLTNQESKKVNSTVSENFRKVPQKQTTSKIDTIYCTQTKKQHGWFLPLDTISKEMASHRNLILSLPPPLSVRVLGKNGDSEWIWESDSGCYFSLYCKTWLCRYRFRCKQAMDRKTAKRL